jgi:hypothetical protein
VGVGVGGRISGVAASIFGGGGGDDDDGLDYGRSDHREHRRRSKDKDRDDDGTRSFFSLPDASRSSFFSGFGMFKLSRFTSSTRR